MTIVGKALLMQLVSKVEFNAKASYKCVRVAVSCWRDKALKAFLHSQLCFSHVNTLRPLFMVNGEIGLLWEFSEAAQRLAFRSC